MRKPKDYDAELAALDSKARELRARKVTQLGELVIACKADTLPVELLAGALLEAAAERDTRRKEAWQAAGAAMFRERRRSPRTAAASSGSGATADASGPLPMATPPSPR